MGFGDLDAASAAIEESLEIGREARADYEIALTLEARGRLAELRGDQATARAAAEESQAILERLGIVSTPSVPRRRTLAGRTPDA
jgi:hypothetical protein